MDITGGSKTKGPLTNIEHFEPFTVFIISEYFILTINLNYTRFL